MFFNSKTNLLKRVGKIFFIGVILTSVFLQVVPEKAAAETQKEKNMNAAEADMNDAEADVGAAELEVRIAEENVKREDTEANRNILEEKRQELASEQADFVAAKARFDLAKAELEAETNPTDANKADIKNKEAEFAAKRKAAVAGTTGACSIWDRGLGGITQAPGANFPNCMAQILYVVLWIASFIVGICTILFDKVFDYTVVNINSFVVNTDAIQVGWTVLRDVSNILFIFILLYLAIATILQIDEHGVKHSLSRLIIAAVLINFSLFFTKIVIDVPNIIAVKIYNTITEKGTDKEVTLGGAFMTIFQPQHAITSQDNGTSIDPNNVRKSEGEGLWKSARGFAANSNPIITFVMGIIIDVTIIFVFLAVTIIFIKRFVILIFLMIFSPLAFAGMAMPMPSIEHAVKDKFWNTLFKEAFYAPIFMLCVYITLKIGTAIVSANSRLAPTTSSTDVSSNLINVPYILGLSVVIVMLVASLIIAEEMGVSGASGAMSAYKGMKGVALGAVSGAAGWAGANTFGSMAHNWVNKGGGTNFRLAAGGLGSKNKFANYLSKNFIGRQIAKTITSGADSVSTNTFGGKKSYKELVDTEEHDIEEALHENHMSDDDMAKLFLEGSKLKAGRRRNAIDRVFDKTDSARLASIGLRMKDPEIAGVHGTDDRYFASSHGHARLAGDKALDVERKQAGSVLSYHRDRFKRLSSDQLPPDEDGHVHPKTSAQITNDWATIRNDFQNYGDKQKTELLSTLNKAEQDALATPSTGTSTLEQQAIKNNFKSLIADNIKTFKQAEQAYNGAMVTDAMKENIDDVAFAGLARARMADTFTAKGMSGFNDSVVATDQFRDELKKLDAFRNMQSIDAMGMVGLMEAYRTHNGGKLAGSDKTFAEAKANMTRVLTETTDYSNIDRNIK